MEYTVVLMLHFRIELPAYDPNERYGNNRFAKVRKLFDRMSDHLDSVDLTQEQSQGNLEVIQHLERNAEG